MNERPNPDKLLKAIENETQNNKKGELKIFFGYAAGVGKTYAMLDAAQNAKRDGVDIIIGYIEPHTRPETMALLSGLEQIQNISIKYKGILLKEFDLDTALKRNPQIIVVDELAHSNADGMRHKKRFNDIEELLNAGIDVYTTVNVQHIESLNDQIAALTNIFVKETIPDIIFDNAQHIELIDIEPIELINRLNSGKIYKPDQANRAINNFFTIENLIALREIALRRTADRVNKEFETVKLKSDIQGNPNEQILVCISNSPSSPKVIRTAARMSEAFHAPLVGIYIEKTNDKSTYSDNHTLRKNVKLAEQLGAKIVSINSDDIAKKIAEYAQINGITKIIIGRTQTSRTFSKKNVVDKLLELSPLADVYVIPSNINLQRYKNIKSKKEIPPFQFSIKDTTITLLILISVTIINIIFYEFKFSDSTLIMVYILGGKLIQ